MPEQILDPAPEASAEAVEQGSPKPGTQAARRPELDVLVVTYNSAATIAPCLRSVAQGGAAARVVVVDNASTDDTVARVRAEFPEVCLIANQHNLGFGRACNQAWLGSSAPLGLLLNPDTLLEPGATRALVDFARAHPRAMLVGPRTLNEDGSLQHSCFRFPSLTMAVTGFFPLLELDSPLNGRYRIEQYDQPHQVDHLLGACLLIRREPIGRLAPFDERFFMYFEETDLCFRSRLAGWENWYTPSAVVVHLGAHSTSQEPERMSAEFYRSQARFYRKNYSPARFAMLKAISLAGVAYWTARTLRGLLAGRVDLGTFERRLASYWAIVTS
jgi:GT2 family glycosyltransferase